MRELAAILTLTLLGIGCRTAIYPEPAAPAVPQHDSSGMTILVPTAPLPQDYGVDQTMTMHHVKKGDTLSSIARQYGVPIQLLIRVNDIKNADLIRVDQELIIPD